MEEQPWWKRLYPLRIPPNWKFLWNKLETTEPAELDPQDKAWLFTFVEDMVYLRRESKGQTVSIDLGWYPDGDPTGAYGLVAILDDNWQDPILEFTSRSTQAVAETMETWLFQVLPYYEIEEKSFRKQHPDRK